MVGLEHRDGEEVGAVSPDVEVSERIHALGGLAIDRAVRIDAEISGNGALRHVRIGEPVVDQQEEGHIGRRLLGFDGKVRGAGETRGRKRG